MHKLVLVCSLVLLCLCSCKDNHPQFNGYIDADLTYLSSNYSGRLSQLVVHRGQAVTKNQLLFKLEQTGENYAVKISQFNHKSLVAQRQQLQAQIQYNDINYQRILRMRKDNAASQNDLDLAIKDRQVLQDQLAGIDFQIRGSQKETADKQWQVQRKENTAPDAGIIFDTYYTTKEYVQSGQPVVSLITKQTIKVIFFVPEASLSQIALNQTVLISSDGSPEPVKGRISYIANIAQYTPPIIYSRENRQDLIFRVEARLENPNLNAIHLGQPVSLELVQ